MRGKKKRIKIRSKTYTEVNDDKQWLR